MILEKGEKINIKSAKRQEKLTLHMKLFGAQVQVGSE